MEKTKKQKAVDIALNVLTAIIVIIILAIGISSIVNANVGFVEAFGTAGISVQTDSMKGDAKDSFKSGDLIYIKTLKDDADKLKEIAVGDIITFWDSIEGKRQLNTHRVIGIGDSGDTVYYTTHGDANPEGVNEYIAVSEVVGKYNGSKLAGMGRVTDFFNGKVGFGVFVIAPSILLVIYAAYCVFKAFKAYSVEKSVKTAEGLTAEAAMSDEEIERLYLERMARREAEGAKGIDAAEEGDKPKA